MGNKCMNVSCNPIQGRLRFPKIGQAVESDPYRNKLSYRAMTLVPLDSVLLSSDYIWIRKTSYMLPKYMKMFHTIERICKRSQNFNFSCF